MKKTIREITAVLTSICSTVAIFADTESTGNLSMALNGDGIPQLIGVVLLIYMYRKVLVSGVLLQDLSKREKIWYGILSVFFAIFMIIGKAQNVNEYLKYKYFAVVLFIGYVPIFFVIVSFLGKKIEEISVKKLKTTVGKVTEWIFEKHIYVGAAIVMLICRVPYIIAFFPCSMTWDGGSQICSFYGIEPFTNHHPPLVSFLYGLIAEYSQAWNIPNIGMFVIPLINMVLSILAVAKVCELFRYLETPYWVRWGSLIYYAAFTVWCIFDMTVIKDSMYYQFTLLFTIQIIYCLIKKKAFFERKSNLILLIVYGLFMSQLRNNGIFVLIFALPVVFFFVERKNKAVFAGASIILFGLIYVINNMLYPALGVTNIAVKEDTYCIMFQQTAKYGQDYPDDVTSEERDFLNTMFDYDELVQVYNPQLADWVKNCLKVCEANSPDHTNREFAEIKSQYFKVWFDQLMRHPMSYINTFLECSYGYYYPEVKPYKEGNGFYEMDRHTFTEGMHDARQIEQLAPARFILEQLSKLEYVPGIGLLYRCGFYTWCVLFAVVYFIIKKTYMNIVMAIPAIVNILVCLISPVNTCIRYALPTMCMIPVLMALILTCGNEFIDGREETN
jgi:hypothetical protein